VQSGRRNLECSERTTAGYLLCWGRASQEDSIQRVGWRDSQIAALRFGSSCVQARQSRRAIDPKSSQSRYPPVPMGGGRRLERSS
jgi:hypothetical protein